MFGDGRENMQGQAGRMRVIHSNKFDAGIRPASSIPACTCQKLSMRLCAKRPFSSAAKSKTSSCRGSMPRFGSVAIHPWRLSKPAGLATQQEARSAKKPSPEEITRCIEAHIELLAEAEHEIDE
jgi:hypothetical protein